MDMLVLKCLSKAVLIDDDYRRLGGMYKTLDPDMDMASKVSLTTSFGKSSVISIRREVFGTDKSRHTSSSFITASWDSDGRIITAFVGPG